MKKRSLYLDQLKKTEFSASRLKSMAKIEKILCRRKNANLKNSVRKPKWMKKSKDYKIPVVNDVSFFKSASSLESKFKANDQPLSEETPIKNENGYVVKNPSFEASKDNSEDADELPSVLSDSLDNLPEKNICNYIKRKWKRPVRKNLAESVPKVIASCFRNLKLSLTQAYNIQERKKSLTDAFKDRSVSPENESIVFYVLKYFSLLEKYNPVRDFKKQPDPSVFLSPFEGQIVSILLDLENAEERFKDLLLSVVVNIRQLILTVNNLSLNASCAFCRIYTLICKSKANSREAISFCCDILKIKHKFGSMLIATIVGVWNDLLDVSHDIAEEEAVFHGCLCLRAQQWGGVDSSRKGLSLSDWEISKCILEKYMSAAPVKPSEDTVDFLVKSIREKCIKETYADEKLLTTPLVLFAAYCGGHWAKVNIVDKYLVPYIGSCIDSAKKAKALTLFCKLYAEICLFYPQKDSPEKVLYELFESGKEDEESKFMQEAAAPALIQLLLLRNTPLPQDLLDWYEANESNQACMFLKFYFHRQSLSNKTDFTEADIL